MVIASRLILSFFVGCLMLHSPAPYIRADVHRTGQKMPIADAQSLAEDDIREVVFRYMFANNASALQGNAKVYFIGVGEKQNPSKELMQRFKGHKPVVRKLSRSQLWNGRVEDKITLSEGLIFRVISINWLSESEVDVYGGYYEGNMSSSGSVYKVAKENGMWVVKKEESGWIS